MFGDGERALIVWGMQIVCRDGRRKVRCGARSKNVPFVHTSTGASARRKNDQASPSRREAMLDALPEAILAQIIWSLDYLSGGETWACD